MKALKIIGLSLLGLLVLLLIVSFFLSSKIHVERSIVVNAAPEVVFDQVNNLKNWKAWSPWMAMDPKAVMTFGEPTAGTGAFYTWKGPEAGEGKMTITASEPYKKIDTEVDFGELGISTAAYTLEPAESGTKLTWGFDLDMGMNPLKKFGGLFIKGMLEKQFDQGLGKIKEIAESAPAPAAESNWKGRVAKVEQVYTLRSNYLAVHDTASVSTISGKLGKAYGMIGEAIGKQKLEVSGAPFAIYYSESNTNFEFDAAIPVKKAGKAAGKVKPGEFIEGNAVMVEFYGDYRQTPMAHEAADKYMKEKGKQSVGPPWELYETDPGVEKDTAKWLTKVYYPIK